MQQTPARRCGKPGHCRQVRAMADTPRHSSAVTLERILVTARDAFAEHGFDGARLDSIARSAGVTKQLVYHYFKTKEELYSVVLDRVSDEVLTMLDSPDYDRLPPEDAVCAMIDRIIQAYVERPYIVGMTVDQDLHKGEHISRRSKYMPSVRAFVANRIAPLLERGAREGIFRPDDRSQAVLLVGLRACIFRLHPELGHVAKQRHRLQQR